MTRQNKSIQKKIIARQFTQLHLSGQKGPSQTKPAHGKVNTEHKIRREKLAATLAAIEATKGKPEPKDSKSKGSKYAQKRK